MLAVFVLCVDFLFLFFLWGGRGDIDQVIGSSFIISCVNLQHKYFQKFTSLLMDDVHFHFLCLGLVQASNFFFQSYMFLNEYAGMPKLGSKMDEKCSTSTGRSNVENRAGGSQRGGGRAGWGIKESMKAAL